MMNSQFELIEVCLSVLSSQWSENKQIKPKLSYTTV